MNKIKVFFKTTMLGGMVVVLPVLLTAFFLRWLFNLITSLIEPVTTVILKGVKYQKTFIDFSAILIIVVICFIVGVIVRTKFGTTIYSFIEKRIFKTVPGYSLFKKTIKQIFGREKKLYSAVALVKPFDNSTMMTALVTDEHDEGWYTVYIPSGINLTSGIYYHIRKDNVFLLDIKVEDAMKSIISCGRGSSDLITQYLQKNLLTSTKISHKSIKTSGRKK